MTTDDVVQQTAGPVGLLGQIYYFHPDTRERAKAAGIRPLGLYFLGRGGALGDVGPAVVSSAFGYFEPGTLAAAWESARETMTPAEATAMSMASAHDIGRDLFAGIDGLDAFSEAAETVIDSCPVDGLPLFAAFAALDRPDDIAARAYHDVIVLRELRGSLHLAVVAALGVPAAVVHAHRRPADVEGFGWSPDAVGPITDEHRSTIAEIDRLTDARHADSLAVLDEGGLAAYVAGIEAMVAAAGV